MAMTREEKLAKNKAYYLENKEAIQARKKAYALANPDKVKAANQRRIERIAQDVVLKQKQKEYQALWYMDNASKVADYYKAYAENNKEKIAESHRKHEKKKAETKKAGKQITKTVKEIKVEVKPEIKKPQEMVNIPDDSKMISRKTIAKDLNISLVTLDRVSRTPHYCMPKHVCLKANLSYLYNRKEIELWYPYALEKLASAKQGERVQKAKKGYVFKQGSMGWGLIMFMRNNKDLILRHTEFRRSQGIMKDGRFI